MQEKELKDLLLKENDEFKNTSSMKRNWKNSRPKAS